MSVKVFMYIRIYVCEHVYIILALVSFYKYIFRYECLYLVFKSKATHWNWKKK